MLGDALGQALARNRLLAIIRGPDATSARRCLETLAAAGIRLAEVSLTTAGALSVIADAAGTLGPVLTVGAGTVRTGDDARAAADAGARFLVSPCLGPGVDTGRSLGLPVVPGAFTATEADAAWRQGASAVKLFPATGGPAYLKALRDPLPEIPFMPVGGIRLEDVDDWFDAGALAVGVGAPLIGDAATGGDQKALARRARDWVAAGALRGSQQ